MDRDTFLAIAATHYDNLQAVGQAPNFFTLEELFDKVWTEFGRVVLEKTIGEVPANHRKKLDAQPATDASR